MAQPGKAFKNFKHRIDSIADPELLETERRSLQRLLVATRLHRILAIEGGIGVDTLPRV